MADRKPQNRAAARARPLPPADKRFKPGESGNPGGRPKSIREVEAMLEREHRNVENMREIFDVVRTAARGVDEPVYYKGEICGHVRKYDSGWMELYLNRVLGPVRDVEIDLSDAPDEVVRWWAEHKVN